MPNELGITISGASVRVMRSYDYCHFEVALSSTAIDVEITSVDVDNMRKEAMRLVDKAVDQYKIARTAAERKVLAEGRLPMLEKEAEEIIKNIPISERTPDQKAKIKAYACYLFDSKFEYDYQDDWRNYE